MKRFYLTIFFTLFFTNSFADIIGKGCPEIIIDLKETFQTNKKLEIEKEFLISNYGFFLEKTYDYQKNKIIFKRKNGYPIISTFLDLDLYNQKKIHSGDLIIKINDKDLSKLNDEEINKIFYSKNINQQIKSSFQFAKKNKKNSLNIDLDQKKYSYYATEPAFQINSINEIDTVNGSFEVNYSLTYDSLHQEMGNYISKYNLFKNNRCPIPAADVEKLSVGQTEFIFLNRSKVSKDEIKQEYMLAYENDPKFKEKYQTASVTLIEQGVAEFRNDFDFKKFPFDNQILKISIMEMYGLKPFPESSLQFLTDSTTFESLKNYKENNILKEWKIKSFDVQTKTADLIGYNIPSAQIDIFIEIERNFLYYLVKIILPIFLILSLSWYVFWIHPKELETRITTSIVCFLALVAYNFVIDAENPKLGYLTYMDWFIMISYFFCALPTIISITLYRYLETERKNILEINMYARFAGPIIYFFLISAVALLILL